MEESGEPAQDDAGNGGNHEESEGLESKVSDNENYDSKHDRDYSKNREKKQNSMISARKESSSIDSKVASASKSHATRTRTNHGAVALIVYKNPATGEVEFLYELKTYDYAIESERGKFGFVGGALDMVDGQLEDSHEALGREFEEEVEDTRARRILKRKLEQEKTPYDVITEYVDGQPAYTYVYRIKINSPLEWAIIKNSRSAGGSGPLYAVKLKDFKDGTVRRNNFIFTQGDFMNNYISEKYNVKMSKEPSHNNHQAHSLLLLQNNRTNNSMNSPYSLPVNLYKAA